MASKKTCIDCGVSKPLDAFYKMHREGPDGPKARQSRCKPCDNRKRTGNYKRNYDGSRRTIVERMADGSLVMSRVPVTLRQGKARDE